MQQFFLGLEKGGESSGKESRVRTCAVVATVVVVGQLHMGLSRTGQERGGV